MVQAGAAANFSAPELPFLSLIQTTVIQRNYDARPGYLSVTDRAKKFVRHRARTEGEQRYKTSFPATQGTSKKDTPVQC